MEQASITQLTTRNDTGKIESKESDNILTREQMREKYVDKPIVETDNQSIREWYVANVEAIPTHIDYSKPREEQIRRAFDLRNQHKHEARVAMSDEETAKMLEEKYPSPSFEDLLKRKMDRKGLTREQALEDIFTTATKTNANVNKEFGL